MDEIDEQQKFRKGFAKMTLLFLVIIALVWGGYYLWSTRWSPEAREMQKYDGNVEKYQAFKANYETAMKADTYGGKTPEETLNMFISALEKGDIDTASKYFALEDNPDDPNYLTRKIWEDALVKAKNEGRIANLLSITKMAVPSNRGTASSASVEFIVKGENGDIDYSISLKQNAYSGVWKIENL